MFKKLKEKITEEVKSSPQRFQQLTQTVTDALQQTSQQADDNFFSIGEDDASTSAASPDMADKGFSSVTLVSPSSEGKMRRSSTSSVASDVSFLPRYEPSNSYHLQSDLDISASELEDNASSSSQLGHLSKEQIYSAFQKSQMRYHKYRGRFTDLARHYKELERENAKMKAVLVETQDKAIRRVTELKEQCSLEQKAKAHLESALRDELDEKQIKIQTLETKIGLLQGKTGDNLIDLDKKDSEKLETLTKYLNDARSEIETLNSKIQEFKANAIVFQSKEQEFKSKIANLEKEMAESLERERENNLKLAENKMDIHNEMLGKETEISNLKKEIEAMSVKLETHEKETSKNSSTKLENLQSQNNKLIEKLENLTKKCNGLENELLKVEAFKMEIENLKAENSELARSLEQAQELKTNLQNGLTKCQSNIKELLQEKTNLIESIDAKKKDYQNHIEELRTNAKKGLFTLEKHIVEKLQKTYQDKEEALRLEFKKHIEEISSNTKEMNEVQLNLIEKENIIKKISEESADLKKQFDEKCQQYTHLEKNHLELIEESSKLRTVTSDLDKQVASLKQNENKDYESKIKRLQTYIKTLQSDIDKFQAANQEKDEDNVQLSQEILQLKDTNQELLEKVKLFEERDETVELETTECDLLKLKVHKFEQDRQKMLEDFEEERRGFNKLLQENKELKIKEEKIVDLRERIHKLEEKVLRLKGYLKVKEESIVELNKIKIKLEQQVITLEEEVRIEQEKEEAIEMDRTESNLLQIKVQQLENEKDGLQKMLEDERRTFSESFHKHSEELSLHKEEIMQENVSISKENLKLKEVNKELIVRVKILEEREEAIAIEKTESDLLTLKLQKMEEQHDRMLHDFEEERAMFNKILVEHKELKLKEEHIKGLEASNKKLAEKIAQLKIYLKNKESSIVDLQKGKLELEQEVTRLKEILRIEEEKAVVLEIDKSECGLLQVKIQALEEEKKSILESFESERQAFEDSFNKNFRNENRIEKLNDENLLLKEENEKLNSWVQQELEIQKTSVEKLRNCELQMIELKQEKDRLSLTIEEYLKKQKQFEDDLSKLKEENDVLRHREEHLNAEMVEFKQKEQKLKKEYETLLRKSKKLESVLEQIKTEKTQCLEKQNELSLRFNSIERELEEKNRHIDSLSNKSQEVQEIRNKLIDLEEQVKAARKDKETADKKLETIVNEKQDLEKNLKAKAIALKSKLKESSKIEEQFQALKQEKNTLREEMKGLLEKVQELTQVNATLQSTSVKAKESDQLRMQNDALHKKCDKLQQEISELKVRVNQISSDNRNLTKEHEKLSSEVSEYRVKEEFLEAEKKAYDEEKGKLEKENNSLKLHIEELKQSKGDTDLNKIQQDFYDIKAKCDNLFIENKNLKAEYTKLEEKCSNFGKVKKDLEAQLSELEHHYNEALHEKQLLQDEVQELKISPINASSSTSSSKLDNLAIVKQETALLSANPNGPNLTEGAMLQRELEHLRDKLTQYKSLDITNKSSIEFYENELHKMKVKNEKLNRKLDETLVTLNHCNELSSSTEIEYLKNILYNYMLGKESLVLAKVIAAVCKFDETQTEAILQKEQQKQTLLGQLGLL